MPDPRPTRGKHRRSPRKTKQQRKQTPHQTPQPSAPGRVIVGEVRKPWGREGLLAVTLNSGRDTVIEPGWTIYLDGIAHTVNDLRPGGRGAIVMGLKAIHAVHTANELKGAVIEVDASALPPPPEGSFYEYQILGLDVVTVDGLQLGSVTEIIETGANDVYVATPASPIAKEVLIPALKDVIRGIDLEQGTITVDLPDGLIPASDDEPDGDSGA